MAPALDAPALPQRQSCDRCHKQKLRCTNKDSKNGSVCDRCFRKRAQCIYSSSLPKGRPKRTEVGGQNSSTSSTASVALSSPSISSASATRQDALGTTLTAAQAPSPPGAHLTLGDDLERIFDECFVHRSSSRMDVYQDCIVSFQQRAEQSSGSAFLGQSTDSGINHESVLSFLTLEMVEMLLKRCGHIERQEPNNALHRNYNVNLLTDCTPTMFDEHCPEAPAPPERHCIIQLIDMWFSVHPFSPIISKSLLIAQYDDGTVDEALLSIILAGTAQSFQHTLLPDDDGTDKAEILSGHATTLLRGRLLSSVDPASFSISTVQTMVLLAWREFCVGHIRRAMCLAAYTCRIIQRLNTFPRKGGQGDRGTLGGVAIDEIENEILQNIGWLCLATSTWAFIQIDQPFPLLSPEELPDLPCLDEAKSAMFRLDRATNNISTLPAQVQAMQRFFPLSHITSTVAYIYTLYLNAPVDGGSTIETTPWQTRHIQRLHRLRYPSYNASMLSSEIRTILSITIQAVETEVPYGPSQCLLLLTYHTIAMHMLFPKRQTDTLIDSHPISIFVLNAFCQAVSEVIAILRRLLPFSISPMFTQSSGWANSAGMLALSLDSCGKALVHIYRDFDHRTLPERHATLDMTKKLAGYARELHQISREAMSLHVGSAARLPKKRLKRMKIAFESLALGSKSTTASSSGGGGTTSDVHFIFSNQNQVDVDNILLDPEFSRIADSSTIHSDRSSSASQENMIPFDPASMLQNFDLTMMGPLMDMSNTYSHL